MYDRDGEVIGMIWADDPRDRLLPSTEILQALRVFANQATAALDSAGRFEEMRFLAEHDPLTRLYNRRAFNHRLRVEAARSRRYGTQFALVVLDVNGFKKINDRHGHMAGDAALARVADLLSHQMRAPDAAFRIGGDEFALILTEIELDAVDAGRAEDRRPPRRGVAPPRATPSRPASASPCSAAPCRTRRRCCARPTPPCTRPSAPAKSSTSPRSFAGAGSPELV